MDAHAGESSTACFCRRLASGEAGGSAAERLSLTPTQVVGVLIAEIAHTTFNVGSVYIPLVAGFGEC